MIAILSPAKTLDFEAWSLSNTSKPTFLKDAKELVAELQSYSPAKIAKLMSVSKKIAELNAERYSTFKTPFTVKNAKPALLAFKGDVYQGIDVESYKAADFKFAQEHVRILSGLYGYLKPKDLIQPYRLEMKTRLKTGRGKDLYQFWGDKITDALNEELKKEKILINLASNEYYKAINQKKVAGSIITPVFKEKKGSEHKIVAIFAKRARGLMTDFIVRERIKKPDDLRDFSSEGYSFQKKLSTDNEYVFTRASKK